MNSGAAWLGASHLVSGQFAGEMVVRLLSSEGSLEPEGLLLKGACSHGWWWVLAVGGGPQCIFLGPSPEPPKCPHEVEASLSE